METVGTLLKSIDIEVRIQFVIRIECDNYNIIQPNNYPTIFLHSKLLTRAVFQLPVFSQKDFMFRSKSYVNNFA